MTVIEAQRQAALNNLYILHDLDCKCSDLQNNVCDVIKNLDVLGEEFDAAPIADSTIYL